MRRLRHLLGLAREIIGYAVVNRAYWLIPVALLLLAVVALIAAGQAAAPFTIYPLF